MDRAKPYRKTEKFKQAYCEAIRLANLKDPQDVKKFMRCWTSAFPALHTKKTKTGRVFTGVKISNMLEYLAHPTRLGGDCNNDIGDKLKSLVEEGYIDDDDISKYFKIFDNFESSEWRKGYLIKDYTTLNIRRHYWKIMQILNQSEADELAATFSYDPWPHATARTNAVLYKYLKSYLIFWMSRHCVGIPDDLHLIQVKTNERGLAVKAVYGLEERESESYADCEYWENIKW